MGRAATKRNRKSRITIETPEQIAARREREELARLQTEAEKREAAKDPKNWGPRGVEPENVVQFARSNQREARAREAVKITFQALYECGTIKMHHAVAGNRCLDICQRMRGQIDDKGKSMEHVDGGLRNYAPVADYQMTAQLEWKRLSSAIGNNASNILLRICMAWIDGRQINWCEVVRTEYNLPQDSHATRETRYLSAMLLASLESAHQHFMVP